MVFKRSCWWNHFVTEGTAVATCSKIPLLFRRNLTGLFHFSTSIFPVGLCNICFHLHGKPANSAFIPEESAVSHHPRPCVTAYFAMLFLSDFQMDHSDTLPVCYMWLCVNLTNSWKMLLRKLPRTFQQGAIHKIALKWAINYCVNAHVIIPSVLWHCWLGGSLGVQPVKTECWYAGGGGDMPVARCRWSALVFLLSPPPPSSLAAAKLRVVWYTGVGLSWNSGH